MSALRVLSLAHTKLTHLPAGLFELTSVRFSAGLEPQQENMQTHTFSVLLQLQTLDLSSNKLSSLTGEDSLMEKMVSLKSLVLDSNQFVSLPSSLNKLTALQFLSVRKNMISSNHVASDLSGTACSPLLLHCWRVGEWSNLGLLTWT
jgi:Leucine-rich repeat (LRR) protein